jgi:hypothetical protein
MTKPVKPAITSKMPAKINQGARTIESIAKRGSFFQSFFDVKPKLALGHEVSNLRP